MIVHNRNIDYSKDQLVHSTHECFNSNKIPLISNHHGDINNENNLKAAKEILRQNIDDINIMEIDFIQYNGEFVSTHDETCEGILNGSLLEKWIDFLVIENHKILWIDLKPKGTWVSFLFQSSLFEVNLLLNKLKYLRKYYKQNNNIDIKNYIMIGSQDPKVRKEMQRLNILERYMGGNESEWLIIIDIPNVNAYITQWCLPYCFQYKLDIYVYNRFMSYDFSKSPLIAIDMTFFENDVDHVFEFIKNNKTIKHNSFIILYSFKRSHPPVHLENYHIIMQYNFKNKDKPTTDTVVDISRVI